MSLIITVHVGEGIVMASDSRSTYNQRAKRVPPGEAIPIVVESLGVHFSETCNKTFLTAANVGLSLAGDLSLNGQPITGLVENFVRDNGNTPVQDVPRRLLRFFNELQEGLNITVFVAGYQREKGAFLPRIYRVFVKENRVEQIDTNNPGAMWGGETDVISRLTGELYLKTGEGNSVDDFKMHTGFPILWQYFTLQDAVDYAQYAVKTTIDTMRFQSRVKTVGGAVDILVIKPDGAQWIAKKELHI